MPAQVARRAALFLLLLILLFPAGCGRAPSGKDAATAWYEVTWRLYGLQVLLLEACQSALDQPDQAGSGPCLAPSDHLGRFGLEALSLQNTMENEIKAPRWLTRGLAGYLESGSRLEKALRRAQQQEARRGRLSKRQISQLVAAMDQASQDFRQLSQPLLELTGRLALKSRERAGLLVLAMQVEAWEGARAAQAQALLRKSALKREFSRRMKAFDSLSERLDPDLGKGEDLNSFQTRLLGHLFMAKEVMQAQASGLMREYDRRLGGVAARQEFRASLDSLREAFDYLRDELEVAF